WEPASAARAVYLQALIAHASGDATSASVLLAEALDRQRGMGDQLGTADTLLAIGQVLMSIGRADEAADVLEEAIQVIQRTGDGLRMLRANTYLAGAIASSRPHSAVRLASAVARSRAEAGAAAWPRERETMAAALAQARERLGDQAYGEAW